MQLSQQVKITFAIEVEVLLISLFVFGSFIESGVECFSVVYVGKGVSKCIRDTTNECCVAISKCSNELY